MVLGDIPYDQIKVGTVVKGNISNGTITKVEKSSYLKEWDEDGWFVYVTWHHSNREAWYVYYYQAKHLTVVSIP